MHFAQIEGHLLSNGADPWSMSVRELISVTESWFLSFFEPAQWSEVTEKLESITARESTQVFEKDGKVVPITSKAMADMADLLAAAGKPPPDAPVNPAEAESGDGS